MENPSTGELAAEEVAIECIERFVSDKALTFQFMMSLDQECEDELFIYAIMHEVIAGEPLNTVKVFALAWYMQLWRSVYGK